MKIIPVIILGFLAITANSFRVNDYLKEFIRVNQQFTADVFKTLGQFDTDNSVMSPMALLLTVALISDGSIGNTQVETRNVTHLGNLLENIAEYKQFFRSLTNRPPVNLETFKLLYANRVYYDKSIRIRNGYSTFVDYTFHTEFECVEFMQNDKVADKINQWVNKATAGEIDHLIDPKHLAQSTKLMAVSNLYFQWTFMNPFLSKFTKSSVFYTSTNKWKTTDYLRSYRIASYGYNYNLKAEFLELPFVNDLDNIFIVFILPDSVNGINDVENNLKQYLETTPLQRKQVAISIPKFGFHETNNFRPVLQILGSKDLFNPKTVNILAITKANNVAIDKIIQKSKISITETGIETGATNIAPGGVELAIQKGDNYVKFNADRPFIFYIKQSSGMVLLVGKVTDPLDAYQP